MINDRAVVEPSGGHPQQDPDEQEKDDNLDDVGVDNGEQPGSDDQDQTGAVLATPEATTNRKTRQPARRRPSSGFQKRAFNAHPPGKPTLTPGSEASSANLETAKAVAGHFLTARSRRATAARP